MLAKKIDDLNELKQICQNNHEPLLIDENTVAMSKEVYDQLMAKKELTEFLLEGLADDKAGRVVPFEEAFREAEEIIRNAQV